MKSIISFLLALFCSAVFSQSLVRESSVTDIVAKRDEQIRIIKNITLGATYDLVLDAMMDAGIYAYPIENKGFMIRKTLNCISNKKNPFENMNISALPQAVQNAQKRMKLSTAYLDGTLSLEQRKGDVLLRAKINPINCSAGGRMNQDENAIMETFWVNLSTSLFIDGIRLLPPEAK